MWKLISDLTILTWHSCFYCSSAQTCRIWIVFSWAWLEVWHKYCHPLHVFLFCLKMATLSNEQTEKFVELIRNLAISMSLPARPQRCGVHAKCLDSTSKTIAINHMNNNINFVHLDRLAGSDLQPGHHVWSRCRFSTCILFKVSKITVHGVSSLLFW